MGYVFFKSTENALNQITELFDFLWPTVASMWNLRWQVNGYLLVRPNATQEELSGRFIAGSDIHSVNFTNSIINQSWEEQKEGFAKILLTNIFAIHESWLSEILGVLNFQGRTKDSLVKKMQFNTSPINRGIWNAINDICSTESNMLKNAFYPTLLSNEKNSKGHLDNLLKCYRYFKECRNSFTHNGGRATQDLINAYNEFLPVANTVYLDAKEVPVYHPVVIDQKVNLDLRGVVGLCNVIIRIICTCDAELSRSKNAEKEFESVWKQSSICGRTLKKKCTADREKQIIRYVTKLGYPLPLRVDEIENFIISKRLAF